MSPRPIRRARARPPWDRLGAGRLRLWRLAREGDPWSPSDSPGRWSRGPDAMVYASTTAALAVLEGRAHLAPEDARRVHRLAQLEVAVRRGEVQRLRVAALPVDWKRRKAFTRDLGERWLEWGGAAALLVPSALVGGELNVLVNVAHPRWLDWRRAARSHEFRFDARLVGPGRP